MLKRTFDAFKAYCVVVYLRMSSDLQNERSPDQQLAEIKRRLAARGYPWKIIKVYRDEAKSGRFLRSRRNFQKMLTDLKSGAIVADLILVDTIERFARVDELPTIRKRLFERHGILVLTADTDFADPTTPQGKALGAFEAMRASEDSRVKAHNVLRGKRDAAELGHWPGGTAPFGLRLKSIMTTVNGRDEVAYSILVPDPATAWIILLLFKTAAEKGWGQTRLAKFLNANAEIPEALKPFHAATVGKWMKAEIYYGELVFGKKSTGIVDDARVVERNAPEDLIRVPNFCEPLVPVDLWKIVNLDREHRARLIENSRKNTAASEKRIQPLARGLTLKYLLTGLVRCGHCGRSMTPSATKAYTDRAGRSNRYVRYVCPGYLGGICQNGQRVPEEWLRTYVVERLRMRLFPGPSDCES